MSLKLSGKVNLKCRGKRQEYTFLKTMAQILHPSLTSPKQPSNALSSKLSEVWIINNLDMVVVPKSLTRLQLSGCSIIFSLTSQLCELKGHIVCILVLLNFLKIYTAIQRTFLECFTVWKHMKIQKCWR